jgi:UDP-N-acetylglucosamine--N-acetylmuramyl-(pentapeptide) pyrophosphoryl-undecaprenol N-acetylglucosamine transferase
MNKKIIITGGGSGGHLSVATAIIDYLIKNKRYPIQDILYVGGDLGMERESPGNSIEQRKMQNAQYKTTFIRAGKLQRTFSLNSIYLLLRTFLGIWDSFGVITKEKPDIIISTGGFVSVPICLVGHLFKKEIYLHEQTASVGLANRIVGKFAKRIYITFENSKKYFNPTKVKLVGNIVRAAVTDKDFKNVSDQYLKLVKQSPQLPLIYISGGGLGSHILNIKILENIEQLLSDYRIILQTGGNKQVNDFQKATEIQKSLEPNKAKRFLVVEYIDDNDIGYVYNKMDFFIGRAGANTVYELGVLAKPALFIPIPWVTNNEQYLNAKVLKDVGTAEILEEKQFDSIDLPKKIGLLMKQLPKDDVNYGKLNKAFPTNAVEVVIEDIDI